MEKIYAKEGEIITCANGHPVGKFTKDVHVRDLPTFDSEGRISEIDFCFETGTPIRGQELKYCICAICGEPYYSYGLGAREDGLYGMHFHFNDGWR